MITTTLLLHNLSIHPLNPIRAGGGLVFFYPHFSCVRARYLKFYDFLNNIKTNLVMLFFCQKVNFCGHRALAKNGQKKAC